MSEALDDAKAQAVGRSGIQTSEFWLSVALLTFAGFALWIGKDEVAMVALGASGLYPISRAVVKR